jgi:hypothetical protein
MNKNIPYSNKKENKQCLPYSLMLYNDDDNTDNNDDDDNAYRRGS